MKYFGCILAISMSIFITGTAIAQDAPFRSLSSARSLKCQFSSASLGKWVGADIKVEHSKEVMVLNFDSIDFKAGKARIIGNQGAGDVITIISPSGLTFIEQTGLGNHIVTTVFSEWIPDTHDFYVVMSRHIGFPGQSPLLSQHYGKCKVWD